MTLTAFMTGAAVVVVALAAITFHEAAHAYAAAACGDDTAKQLGRASLNPLRHIDLFGTILLPATLYLLHAPFLVGWAKPVPVDWSRLRHWRRDVALVAAAGPAANFALAAVSWLALAGTSSSGLRFLAMPLGVSVVLNLILAVFNLIPIPPLDGSKVVAAFLPEAWARWIIGFRRRRAGLKWITGEGVRTP